MDPISMITLFVGKVFGYVSSGIAWRRQINSYELSKKDAVIQKYMFRLFPIDFVSIRRSKFANDNTTPGSQVDYAQTYIMVNDIYPFVLNAHSSYVYVHSFRKTNPSYFDNEKLNVGEGYILGLDDLYHPINANHVKFDKAGTKGILSFYTEPGDVGRNRIAHTKTEKGKAYTLAPNVKPNIITKAQILVNGNNWIYAIIILLIVITSAISSKGEKK